VRSAPGARPGGPAARCPPASCCLKKAAKASAYCASVERSLSCALHIQQGSEAEHLSWGRPTSMDSIEHGYYRRSIYWTNRQQPGAGSPEEQVMAAAVAEDKRALAGDLRPQAVISSDPSASAGEACRAVRSSGAWVPTVLKLAQSGRSSVTLISGSAMSSSEASGRRSRQVSWTCGIPALCSRAKPFTSHPSDGANTPLLLPSGPWQHPVHTPSASALCRAVYPPPAARRGNKERRRASPGTCYCSWCLS
jgi:hypothetical protein